MWGHYSSTDIIPLASCLMQIWRFYWLFLRFEIDWHHSICLILFTFVLLSESWSLPDRWFMFPDLDLKTNMMVSLWIRTSKIEANLQVFTRDSSLVIGLEFDLNSDRIFLILFAFPCFYVHNFNDVWYFPVKHFYMCYIDRKRKRGRETDGRTDRQTP